MDSSALLDYALLKLTPTRTRCDLVVVSGGKTEKLASGLVEPFIAHLKFAKDQIPKGGYSIALRPPSSAASWFTKATFQRFVRFVSTPEILERFMRLEKEILQIESSNNESNSISKSSSEEGTPPAKSKGEVDGDESTAAKENSKYRLQCLLDTRKALLRKEQAMAYARATVAGFEVEQMDDLICFANAFGASRLREACIDFMELYKQKHTDCQWMDEVTAMKAFSPAELSFLGNSGVVLACENGNGSLVRSCSLDTSSDSKESQLNSDGVGDNNLPASTKAQMQMPWPNQMPPYMYNFPGPVPPMSFPGMHPVPPYYPGHMHWAQAVDDASNGLSRENSRKHHHKSSRKKEKVSHSDAPESSEDENNALTNSDSETDSDESGKDEKEHLSRQQTHGRKHKKKSSKTVVIRNINYITSKRRDGGFDDSSSLETTSLDEDSIKQQVDDAISVLEQGHNKKTHKHSNRGHQDSKPHNGSNGGFENWDAFQNILMSREDEEKQTVSFNGEDCMMKNSDDGVTNGHAVNLESEKVRRKHLLSDDSVIVTERNGAHTGDAGTIDFANGEDIRPGMKRRDSENVQFLLPQTREGSGSTTLGTASDFAVESCTIRNKSGDDWFVANKPGNFERQGAKDMVFENGDSLLSDREANKRATVIDDSFIIQSRSMSDDQCSSQWKTDINMDADFITAAQPENSDPVVSQTKPSSGEPNDLCVVLAREPGMESAEVSWMPELDYEIEASFAGINKSSPATESNAQAEESSPVKGVKKGNKKDMSPSTKTPAKDTKSKLSPGYLSRSRIDALSKSKKMSPTNKPGVQKSKLEREEEARKRTEELVLERQRRIAERTAASGLTPSPSKKVPAGSKTASPKLEKHRVQPSNSRIKAS
nr:COP1-interacting protein 7 [Ipomoea batatas]